MKNIWWMMAIMILMVGCASAPNPSDLPQPSLKGGGEGVPVATLTAHAGVVYAQATETQQAWDVRLAEAQALEETAVYAREALEATQQAARDEAARQALAGTQQAQAVETQQAAVMTQAAQATRAVETQQAAVMTQSAQATETQRAWDVQVWQMRSTDAAATSTDAASQALATGTAAAGVLIAQRTATAESIEATKAAAQAAAAVTLAQAQAERAKLALEREREWNEVKAAMPYLLGGVIALVFILLAVALLIRRDPEVVRDAQGNPLWVIEAMGRATNVLLPGRSLGPGLVSSERGVSGMNAPVDVQERVTAREQGGANSPTPGPSLKGGEVEVREVGPVGMLPERVAWREMEGWHGGALPLGMGARGLITAADVTPHLLVAGTTGSGKSRFVLRPVMAAALADGWLVVALDKSGIDFRAFSGHVNFHLALWNEPEEVISYLKRVYGLVVERQRWLTKAGKSQWGANPPTPSPSLKGGGNMGGRVLVVIDEFSTLADNLESAGRMELWRWARMIAAEGRKSGIVLALALQDPTAQSIDLRIRRNCSAVALRVQDETASRVIINEAGAEKLELGQFLARVGGLQAGVTFKPSDHDIQDYLKVHPALAIWDAEWLLADGEVIEVRPETTDEKIRRLAREGMSLNEIQRQVFNGRTGGAFFNQVRAAMNSPQPPLRRGEPPSTTGSTTTTTGGSGTGGG